MGSYKNHLGQLPPLKPRPADDRSGQSSVLPVADSQLVNLAALPSQPWKNGGGLSTDIAINPPGATLEDFRWRVSRAVIERDGPFSLFPGMTRWITLVDGRGCQLDFADGTSLLLTKKHQVYCFSGSLAARCTLQGNHACTVFNVIARDDLVMRVNLARSRDPMPSLGHAVVSATGAAVRIDAAWVLTAKTDS